MSKWSGKIFLSLSDPFGIQVNNFVTHFRKSSKRFVIEILTKNLALNISGALFFMGLGCSLKWWYKDQLFIVLLKQNLPALSEPQQKLSWETGEYVIKEQNLALAKQTFEKPKPYMHIPLSIVTISACTTEDGHDVNSVASIPTKAKVANYAEGSCKVAEGLENKLMHLLLPSIYWSSWSTLADPLTASISGLPADRLRDTVSQCHGKPFEQAIKKTCYCEGFLFCGTPKSFFSSHPYPKGVRGEFIRQSDRSDLGNENLSYAGQTFHQLLERLDLYMNHIVVKFKPPWQKHAYQRFLGLFSAPTFATSIRRNTEGKSIPSAYTSDQYGASAINPKHTNIKGIDINLENETTSEVWDTDFYATPAVLQSKYLGAASLPTDPLGACEAGRAASQTPPNLAKQPMLPSVYKGEPQSSLFTTSAGLVDEKNHLFQKQKNFSTYTTWKTLFPETWFKLSARNLCLLKDELPCNILQPAARTLGENWKFFTCFRKPMICSLINDISTFRHRDTSLRGPQSKKKASPSVFLRTAIPHTLSNPFRKMENPLNTCSLVSQSGLLQNIGSDSKEELGLDNSFIIRMASNSNLTDLYSVILGTKLRRLRAILEKSKISPFTALSSTTRGSYLRYGSEAATIPLAKRGLASPEGKLGSALENKQQTPKNWFASRPQVGCQRYVKHSKQQLTKNRVDHALPSSAEPSAFLIPTYAKGKQCCKGQEKNSTLQGKRQQLFFPLELTKIMAGWQPPSNALLLNSYLDEIPYKLESVLQNAIKDVRSLFVPTETSFDIRRTFEAAESKQCKGEEQSETFLRKAQLLEMKQLLQKELQFLIHTLSLVIVDPSLTNEHSNVKSNANKRLRDWDTKWSNLRYPLLSTFGMRGRGIGLTKNCIRVIPNELETGPNSLTLSSSALSKLQIDSAFQVRNKKVHFSGVARQDLSSPSFHLAPPVRGVAFFAYPSSPQNRITSLSMDKQPEENALFEQLATPLAPSVAQDLSQTMQKVKVPMHILKKAWVSNGGKKGLAELAQQTEGGSRDKGEQKPIGDVNKEQAPDSIRVARENYGQTTKDSAVKKNSDISAFVDSNRLSTKTYSDSEEIRWSLPSEGKGSSASQQKESLNRLTNPSAASPESIDPLFLLNNLGFTFNNLSSLNSPPILLPISNDSTFWMWDFPSFTKSKLFMFKQKHEKISSPKNATRNNTIFHLHPKSLTWEIFQQPNYEQPNYTYFSFPYPSGIEMADVKNWKKKLKKKINFSWINKTPKIFFQQRRTTIAQTDLLNIVDKGVNFVNKRSRFMSGYVYPDLQSQSLRTNIYQWLATNRIEFSKQRTCLAFPTWLYFSSYREEFANIFRGIALTKQPYGCIPKVTRPQGLLPADEQYEEIEEVRSTGNNSNGNNKVAREKNSNKKTLARDFFDLVWKLQTRRDNKKSIDPFTKKSHSLPLGDASLPADPPYPAVPFCIPKVASAAYLTSSGQQEQAPLHSDKGVGSAGFWGNNKVFFSGGRGLNKQNEMYWFFYPESFRGVNRLIDNACLSNIEIPITPTTFLLRFFPSCPSYPYPFADPSGYPEGHSSIPQEGRELSPYGVFVSLPFLPTERSSDMQLNGETKMKQLFQFFSSNRKDSLNKNNLRFCEADKEIALAEKPPLSNVDPRFAKYMQRNTVMHKSIDCSTKLTSPIDVTSDFHKIKASSPENFLLQTQDPLLPLPWGCSASIPQVGSTATFGMQRGKDSEKSKGACENGTLRGNKIVLPYEKFNHHVAFFPGFAKPSQFFLTLPQISQGDYVKTNAKENFLGSTISPVSTPTIINPMLPFRRNESLDSSGTGMHGSTSKKSRIDKFLTDCNVRGTAYRGIVIQRNKITKDLQPFKETLGQSSTWSTLFLGPENPLTDRQCHFFGQKQLSTLDVNHFQRDYLRQLGKEIVAQSNGKGFTEKLPSIERVKILSFSKTVNSFFFKKRKYAYLLEKTDHWHLLFQEQLRTALEDMRKYPPLTPEETKNNGSGRIKVSAPLIMTRFPKKIAKTPLSNLSGNPLSTGNKHESVTSSFLRVPYPISDGYIGIAYSSSYPEGHPSIAQEGKEPSFFGNVATLPFLPTDEQAPPKQGMLELQHAMFWRPFCYVKSSCLLSPKVISGDFFKGHLYLPSFILANGCTQVQNKDLSRQTGGRVFAFVENNHTLPPVILETNAIDNITTYCFATKKKAIYHYPLLTERQSLELTNTPWLNNTFSSAVRSKPLAGLASSKLYTFRLKNNNLEFSGQIVSKKQTKGLENNPSQQEPCGLAKQPKGCIAKVATPETLPVKILQTQNLGDALLPTDPLLFSDSEEKKGVFEGGCEASPRGNNQYQNKGKNLFSVFNISRSVAKNLQWFIQEPLTGNSWAVISQWFFLVALLFWIEQMLLGNVFPALFALEQMLLGTTGIKISDRTQILRVSQPSASNTPKFQNLAGVDGLLGELSELVLFLRGHKERLWNKKSSYGVLLTGPPGTGKTFLVRALANEARVPVLILSAGTLIASKLNTTKPSWSIRHAFRRAKQLAPCILFIDEIDALGKSRGKIVTDSNEIIASAFSTSVLVDESPVPKATFGMHGFANFGMLAKQTKSAADSAVLRSKYPVGVRRAASQEQTLDVFEKRSTKSSIQSQTPTRALGTNSFLSGVFSYQQSWPSVSDFLLNEWEHPLKSLILQESNQINRCSICEEKLFDLVKVRGYKKISANQATTPTVVSNSKPEAREPNIKPSFWGAGDSTGKSRGTPKNTDHFTQNFVGNGGDSQRKFGPLTQLLVSMDGVSSLSGVLIMGATNRPELLDSALTRPGRFERIIRIEKPSEQKRIEILQLYSHNLGVQHQIPWHYLANRTRGLTAADLAVAMNYSSLKAIIQGSTHTIETIEYGLNSITRFFNKPFGHLSFLHY